MRYTTVFTSLHDTDFQRETLEFQNEEAARTAYAFTGCTVYSCEPAEHNALLVPSIVAPKAESGTNGNE